MSSCYSTLLLITTRGTLRQRLDSRVLEEVAKYLRDVTRLLVLVEDLAARLQFAQIARF